MIFHMLLSDEQRCSIPEEIRQVEDFGELTIIINPEAGPWNKKYFNGYHLLLEGQADSFKEWMYKYNSIYVGVGSPMEQRFVHMEKE